jgi:hypothetical protein
VRTLTVEDEGEIADAPSHPAELDADECELISVGVALPQIGLQRRAIVSGCALASRLLGIPLERGRRSEESVGEARLALVVGGDEL